MHPAKWFLPGAAVVISACSHQLPQAEMTFQREEADIRQVLEDQQNKSTGGPRRREDDDHLKKR